MNHKANPFYLQIHLGSKENPKQSNSNIERITIKQTSILIYYSSKYKIITYQKHWPQNETAKTQLQLLKLELRLPLVGIFLGKKCYVESRKKIGQWPPAREASANHGAADATYILRCLEKNSRVFFHIRTSQWAALVANQYAHI